MDLCNGHGGGGGGGTEMAEELDLEALELELGAVGRTTEAPEVHVEVALRRECVVPVAEVERLARAWAAAQAALEAGAVVRGAALGALRPVARALVVCDAGHAPGQAVAPHAAALTVHVHALHDAPPARDALGADGGDGSGSGEGGACEVWPLPHARLLGAWEALVLEGPLKGDALRLVSATLELADGDDDDGASAADGGQAGRALLLHGPPGCGKTSLCRALAHKLAVRLGRRFPRARLIEVDAHSLFSRWFSESGKLVARLFQQILDLTDDPHTLTIVLVDEVESLAAARASAAAGLEPSDAVRAVNALLTGLDRLRRRPNALLLATSNVTRAVDAAFVDRADLVRLVGPPGPRAAYALLHAAAARLVRAGRLAGGEPLWPLRVLEASRFAPHAEARASLALWRVARAAAARRVSCRALARLPLLALALHLPAAAAVSLSPAQPPPSLPSFVLALARALHRQLRDEDDLRAAHDARTD